MKELIRHVRLRYHPEYELKVWDTGRCDWRGQTVLGYEFSDHQGTIFAGEDFSGSPMNADDSDETLICLLGFLTLRPGDTDAEYFANYSDVQHHFAAYHAEELSIYGCEPGMLSSTPDETPRFIDVE